jgi:nitrogenase subunit NifH
MEHAGNHAIAEIFKGLSEDVADGPSLVCPTPFEMNDLDMLVKRYG